MSKSDEAITERLKRVDESLGARVRRLMTENFELKNNPKNVLAPDNVATLEHATRAVIKHLGRPASSEPILEQGDHDSGIYSEIAASVITSLRELF